MKTIVIFGPPGSGKSTLINLLRREGIRLVIDLEDAPKLWRNSFVQMKRYRLYHVVAAAGTQMDDYVDIIKIFLIPNKQQTQLRDLGKPGKVGQLTDEEVASWEKQMNKRDEVIKTDVNTIFEVLKRLLL